jgi:hypothetical protein
MDYIKNKYLDAIDLIDDHPHYTFWVILAVAVVGILI